jgi:hypothetical protein
MWNPAAGLGCLLIASIFAGCGAATGTAEEGDAGTVTDAGLPACPRAPFDAGGVPGPVEGAAAVRAAPAIAVAQVQRADEECSDAGGLHLTLRVASAGCGVVVGSAHLGGHAFMLRAAVGDWLVVGLDPARPLTSEQRSEPGWCLVAMPAVDATVIGSVRAASEVDARAQLAALLR